MGKNMTQLKFNINFDPNRGKLVEIAPNIARLVAPNASPFTFTGTNSYFIGDENLVIIDPGPDDENHLEALMGAIAGRKLAAILLTHTHKDHSGLAKDLSKKTGAPIWFGGRHRLSRKKNFLEVNLLAKACDWELVPDREIFDGDLLKFGDVEIEVIATAGHCANHLSFAISGTPYVFTGDHVMGWNSSLVATPDGSLADYFNSLDKLIDGEFGHFFPAHGGEIKDGKAYAKALKARREKRNRQILVALNGEKRSIKYLLDLIYPSHKGRTRFAARLTLIAHLEYLIEQKLIGSRFSYKGWVFFAI